MAGVNKVTILGNLGNAPDIRTMPNGDMIATISVATSRQWKDQTTGETKELVEWHRIVFFRRLAEIIEKYVRKGSKLYTEGYLRTRKWTDEQGIDRWTTEIVGEELQLLDSKPKNEQVNTTTEPVQNKPSSANKSELSKNNIKTAEQNELPVNKFDDNDDIPY